jgi:hypothetical protein
MALTGNKGEWSEIYVLLKLLGDKKVFSGDESLNKIESLFYPIVKILRQESDGEYCYSPNGDIVLISGGLEELRIPIAKFQSEAQYLLSSIKKSTGSSFSIPEIEEFMSCIYCKTLKAPSSDKTDIKIVIHDLRTNQKPLLGFSIKSQLGSPSTLLNPGVTTNVIYTIAGQPLSDDRINKINSVDSTSKVLDRIQMIYIYDNELKYLKFESTMFENNLKLIDGDLPVIISEVLKQHYIYKLSKIKDIVAQLQKDNPLNYDVSYGHAFYEYKIKHFLTDVALGMTPSKKWNGNYDANGGYLIVKEDGNVLCYHIYNKSDFENYLLNNTKIDTASTTRYKFGIVEKAGGTQVFKLNLQIRFI